MKLGPKDSLATPTSEPAGRHGQVETGVLSAEPTQPPAKTRCGQHSSRMRLRTRLLGDVVRGLPSVKPNLTFAAIRTAFGIDLDTPSGRKVTTNAPPLFEIIPSGYGAAVVVYPDGVKRIIDMYAAGAFQLKRGAVIAAPSDDLVHFATLITPEAIEAEEQRFDARDATEPVTFAILERAYWRWADRACPHPPRSDAAKQWLATASFVYRSIAYRRTRESMESNTGKSSRWWTEYDGADGSSYATDRPQPNRRNDPERNWRLGRE